MAGIVYNTNQDIELTGKLMLKLGDEPMAFGTTAKLTMQTDMVDTTNMMSGDWKDEVPGLKSFTVSSDALLTHKTGAVSADTLIAKQIADELIPFVFGTFKRSGDETAGYTFALDTTKPSYKGNIRITSLEMTGEASTKLVKYSMSANGSGPLTQVAAVTA